MQILSTLLTEMLLKQDGVAGVATEDSINQVTEEGHEADDEVEEDIEEHPDLDGVGQAALDRQACF
jgi:hypothetical protein